MSAWITDWLVQRISVSPGYLESRRKKGKMQSQQLHIFKNTISHIYLDLFGFLLFHPGCSSCFCVFLYVTHSAFIVSFLWFIAVTSARLYCTHYCRTIAFRSADKTAIYARLNEPVFICVPHYYWIHSVLMEITPFAILSCEKTMYLQNISFSLAGIKSLVFSFVTAYIFQPTQQVLEWFI